MEAFRDSFLEQLGTPVWSELCAKTTKMTTFINMDKCGATFIKMLGDIYKYVETFINVASHLKMWGNIYICGATFINM